MNIPKQYDEKLKELLKEMENETKCIYKLTITDMNFNYVSYTIGDVRKVKVFDIHGYKDLEGVHDSINAFKHKLDEILNKESSFRDEKLSSDLIDGKIHVTKSTYIWHEQSYKCDRHIVGYYSYI